MPLADSIWPGGYEGYVLVRGRSHPDRMARYAHARMRVAWVASLNPARGFQVTTGLPTWGRKTSSDMVLKCSAPGAAEHAGSELRRFHG